MNRPASAVFKQKPLLCIVYIVCRGICNLRFEVGFCCQIYHLLCKSIPHILCWCSCAFQLAGPGLCLLDSFLKDANLCRCLVSMSFLLCQSILALQQLCLAPFILCSTGGID